MKNERALMIALLVLQLVLWLGFLFHRAPRFAGSLTGGVLGLSAALLLLVPPLLYSAVKRIEVVKQLVTKRVSLGTLLTWHVYTGILGAILAILHTGHRFESTLGIWLVALMMLTVFSGFVGRYFLGYSSMELREKQDLLTRLATEYNHLVGALARRPNAEVAYAAAHELAAHAFNSFVGTAPAQADVAGPLSVRALRLAESIADLEYAIETHEVLKKRTARWLYAHTATSVAFYLLLVFHIWSSVYFGLRWFN
ncbi:hypothetical protein MON38_20055 [Hymenobacter sp. DH14]|uniref:Iron reductase n=1 Tax=Hymenobacter cyanobacteriorum TaxID=2926463 RepID=A0A9X1VK73_9BACT|nr:hypothetical protein [Hymenobacter cyanobacteriorum]MCI1189723.1 hypothetical protein [Hymenobacter cyanobacteriorum]